MYREYLNKICPHIKFGFHVSKFHPLLCFLKTPVHGNCKQGSVVQNLSRTCVFTHEPNTEFAPNKTGGTDLAQRTIRINAVATVLQEIQHLSLTYHLPLF